MESKTTAQYTEALDAEQRGQFDRARNIYESVLTDLSGHPANEDWSDAIRDTHFRYAEFHLRWAAQPDDCFEFKIQRLRQAERDLQLAQGSITDRLGRHEMQPGVRDRLFSEAGAIDSLLGRVFTARGAIYIKYGKSPASATDAFKTAQLFYRSAERYFSQGYDHHARILNAIHGARQERLLDSRLGVYKWLGVVATELFREQLSYPQGARRSRHARDIARKDLANYDATLAAVLLRP